ncbi:conserved hypothetical protein [Paraburkholderia piptadeniae]|uniref:Uncharacterized protein n=1 Tax=Paraburkholderia piptadeniae TaxID=1701573 RepID=A0A1N7S2L0_9BURK|nr:conserved hypothetical protein [Paraburkholderia piptadeniae]
MREYAPVPNVCDDVAFECAKLALALARVTRRKHGAARWNSGAPDADLERELDVLIVARENRRNMMRKRATPLSTPMSASPLTTGQTSPGGITWSKNAGA